MIFHIKKVIVLLCILPFVLVNAEYDSCPTSNSEKPVTRLKDSLMCAYDSSIGPITDEDSTNVTFSLLLKYFIYEPLTSVLSFDAWMVVQWKDRHLTWTPSDHNGIKSLYLHTSEIWTPDLSIYNNANQGDDPLTISYTKCVVSNVGKVLCVPPVHIDALCIPDMSKFPFDVHNCSLRFGSWIHKGEQLNFTLSKNVINTKALPSNGEWKIDSYTAIRRPGNFPCCPNETYPSIEISFKISRLSGAHAASIVIPTLVCLMVTITALALSPLDKERLTICNVNLVVHFLQLQYTSFTLPLKGENIPLIILFGRDSLLMAIFALIATVFLKYLMSKKTTPPNIVSTIVSVSSVCRIPQDLKINNFTGRSNTQANDDQEAIIETNTQCEEWFSFGQLLDRLLLVGYIIGYFVMMIGFLP